MKQGDRAGSFRNDCDYSRYPTVSRFSRVAVARILNYSSFFFCGVVRKQTVDQKGGSVWIPCDTLRRAPWFVRGTTRRSSVDCSVPPCHVLRVIHHEWASNGTCREKISYHVYHGMHHMVGWTEPCIGLLFTMDARCVLWRVWHGTHESRDMHHVARPFRGVYNGCCYSSRCP